MSVRAKLFVGAVILLAVTFYVAYLGASSSWQYYVTVDECLDGTARFAGRKVRVSGLVAPGSLRIADDRISATFVLRGKSSELQTFCRGPLPDNLADDMAVVAEGTLDEAGLLRAEKVLTRCASKYESQP
jgi:cytochrome c-type biogenesis protein CcmE